MTTNIFEQASRAKLRFDTSKGQNSASVEDLWTLPLTAGGDLDKLAKALKKQLGNTDEEESFIRPSNNSAAVELTKLKFAIVKYIVDTRLEERDVAQKAQAKAESNRRIDEIIARKQEGKLEEMSIEDLQKLRDGN